jgi:tetratricopeptide (TPR) repeat protein
VKHAGLLRLTSDAGENYYAVCDEPHPNDYKFTSIDGPYDEANDASTEIKIVGQILLAEKDTPYIAPIVESVNSIDQYFMDNICSDADALVEFERLTTQPPQKTFDSLYNTALENLKSGNYQVAVQNCKDALENDPRNSRKATALVYKAAGDAHLALGEKLDAAISYGYALDMDKSLSIPKETQESTGMKYVPPQMMFQSDDEFLNGAAGCPPPARGFTQLCRCCERTE